MGRGRPETDAEERAYLSRVLGRIRREQASAGEGAGRVGDELARLRRWWTDDEAREATQLLDRAQNMPLLQGLEAEAGARARRLRQLSLEARRPYFGRLSFREAEPEPRDAAEAFYVGLGGVWDDRGEPLVIDWRTPMAGLYYDAEPGPAAFWGPDGRVAGTVVAKRQYQIARGALVGFFDTALHIGDDLLARALAARGAARMPSIVATIQREQNQAIRDGAHRVLLVTGPAGSGKTAVALQRLAYLLYHRPKLSAAEMLFVVPNRVFADYVSDVLPELGEDNPRCATWEDLVSPWLPAARVESRAHLTDAWMSGQLSPERLAGIRLRGRRAFLELLDDWLATLGKKPLPFRDVAWDGVLVATAAEMGRWWTTQWAGRPVSHRLGLMQEQLGDRLRGARRRVTAHVRAELIEGQGERGDDGLAEAVRHRVDKGAEAARALVADGGMVDWAALYRSLYVAAPRWESVGPEAGELDAATVLADIRHRLARGPLPFEDMGPLAYVKASLLRPQLPWAVRLVMVEEAHALTACQLAVLRRLMPAVPVTLVGDGEQVLVAGLGWPADEAIPLPWPREETGAVALTRTYRSAPAIAAWCRQLVGESPVGAGLGGAWALAERSAVPEAPELVQVSDGDWPPALARLVRQAPADGTLAVICATTAEAEAVAGLLAGAGRPLELLDDPAGRFPGGAVVLPLAMAGGLEFDAVVVANVSAYRPADARQALYVAASRARHRLAIVCRGDWPAWLPAAGSASGREAVEKVGRPVAGAHGFDRAHQGH